MRTSWALGNIVCRFLSKYLHWKFLLVAPLLKVVFNLNLGNMLRDDKETWGKERNTMSRQWQPLVTSAAVAREMCTAMMNQPCQGKLLPGNTYFITFPCRGNNKKRRQRRRSLWEKKQEIESEAEGRDQTVGPHHEWVEVLPGCKSMTVGKTITIWSFPHLKSQHGPIACSRPQQRSSILQGEVAKCFESFPVSEKLTGWICITN